MTINVNEMDREALLSYANEIGVKANGTMKDDTIRDNINKALGTVEVPQELKSHSPNNIVTSESLRSPPKRDELSGSSHNAVRVQDRVKIKIFNGRGPNPVQVGVNGYMFSILRDHVVEVPYSVVAVLNNSVEKKYKFVKDQLTGLMKLEKTDVQCYPFTIMGGSPEALEKLNA